MNAHVADGMSCRTGTACSGAGVVITPIPGPAEVITAGPLHAAGVMVTGVDINELDTTLTTGPWRGREAAQATARIEFTTAGTAAAAGSLLTALRGHGRPWSSRPTWPAIPAGPCSGTH